MGPTKVCGLVTARSIERFSRKTSNLGGGYCQGTGYEWGNVTKQWVWMYVSNWGDGKVQRLGVPDQCQGMWCNGGGMIWYDVEVTGGVAPSEDEAWLY